MMRLLLFLIVLKTCLSDPLVQLPSGWIRGRQAQTHQKTSFYAFEQIPYAKPPVGELRFKSPQPPDSWEGVLNTTHLDKICIQLTRKGPESEDCLYLNVFTSKLLNESDNSLLPVMFYIHGGGFYDGTARNLGPDLYIDNGVVYVAANYRMGPFGFLSTGDSLIPGNNGLKDLLLALRWVNDNIRLFGGDPERITIFGHSAGGAVVSYFLINEKTEGLYSGAISQSGAALNIWALHRNPKTAALTFAKFLKNSSLELDTKKLVDYLQNASTEELKEASYNFYFNYIFKEKRGGQPSLQGVYFGPVIEEDNEDAFITGKMYKSFKDGRVVKVPLMIGFTSEECLEYFTNFNRSEAIMEAYDQNLELIVPPSMKIEDRDNRTKMGFLIRDIYTKGGLLSENIPSSIGSCSDNLLTRGIIKQAEFYSNYAPTYFYVFSYDGKLGNINISYEGAGRVGHGEENRYLMCSGSNCNLSQYPEQDRLMQKKLIELWTNFAKFRNPTPADSENLDNVRWPVLSVENGDFFYLDIDSKLSVQNHPKESYQKWEELFGMLGYNDFDTY